MGAGHEWICNTCGYAIKTSGSWEFYRDSKGQHKPYGHPGAGSEEARNAGIKGFSTEAYCPTCDSVIALPWPMSGDKPQEC